MTETRMKTKKSSAETEIIAGTDGKNITPIISTTTRTIKKNKSDFASRCRKNHALFSPNLRASIPFIIARRGQYRIASFQPQSNLLISMSSCAQHLGGRTGAVFCTAKRVRPREKHNFLVGKIDAVCEKDDLEILRQS